MSKPWKLDPDRLFDPNPPMRSLARSLYAEVEDLPIVGPHGHVPPALLADQSATLGTPAELFIIPDHYVFRMLYSQGVQMEDLGVPTVDGTHAFASIPSRHDVWRRITCDWLAGTVQTGVVDEAPDMAREFAYGLAKKAYGFQREPVGRA